MVEKLEEDKLNKVANFLRISFSEVKKILLSQEESSRMISSIATIQEARDVYNVSPEGSGAQRKALEKWISLCSTIQEAEETFNVSPGGSEAERKALEKWISLCSTIQEAEEAFNASPGGGEAERTALEKLYELI